MALLQVTNNGNYLEIRGPNLPTLLMNFLQDLVHDTQYISISRNTFGAFLKKAHNTQLLLIIHTSHDNFVNQTCVELFSTIQAEKIPAFLLPVTDDQLYTALSTTKGVTETTLHEISILYLPMAIQLDHFLQKNQELFDYPQNYGWLTWTRMGYYSLQSLASVSYGQVLTRTIKDKLVLLSAIFALYKFGLLDANTNPTVLRKHFSLLAKTEQLDLAQLLENLSKILPLFQNGLRKGIQLADLPKFLFELLNTLSIVVKYPAVLYFTSRNPLQTKWFFTINGSYNVSWWMLDAYTVLTGKIRGLYKVQKDILKQAFSRYKLSTRG